MAGEFLSSGERNPAYRPWKLPPLGRKRITGPVARIQYGPGAGGGGFAESTAALAERRRQDVLRRIPGMELRDVSQAGILEALQGGPMGGFREFDPEAGGELGFTPEEQAFKRYWPEMESRLFGSLSRKGFTSGAAPGAAIAKGGAAFAAPLAVEHARGQERRRNQYVRELFDALRTSISGAGVAGGLQTPDWMEAAKVEGAGYDYDQPGGAADSGGQYPTPWDYSDTTVWDQPEQWYA